MCRPNLKQKKVKVIHHAQIVTKYATLFNFCGFNFQHKNALDHHQYKTLIYPLISLYNGG